MAVTHGGTNANNSLTSLVFKAGFRSGMAEADVRTIRANIKNDQINSHAIVPEAFSYNGLLMVPNRGVLKCLPGDLVLVDATTGWPILVSALSLASGPWTNV